MGNSERATQAQFELLVSYMERHGDIQYLSKLECDRRWIELTDLLNNKSLGEPKPIDKWRKCWSDFKNNTKRKDTKIRSRVSKAGLSKIEKRVLKLLENKKRKSVELDNEIANLFKPSPVPDEAPCEMPPSPLSPPPQNCIQDVEYEFIDHRKSSTSSFVSETSLEGEDAPTPEKRKKPFKDNIKDIAEKYLEFEREREKLGHEREMARIRQSNQLILIFGKVVNVLERLTPSIQKYLDYDNNGDR